MQYLNDNEMFIEEFIQRTRKIIAQYETVQGEHYESTLLANCLLGLLVFPEGKYFDQLNDNLISAEHLVELNDAVKRNLRKNLTLQYLLRRMRNAASHGHVFFSSATAYKADTEIHDIILFDNADTTSKKTPEQSEFYFVMEIEKLKQIIFEFCDNILQANQTAEPNE